MLAVALATAAGCADVEDVTPGSHDELAPGTIYSVDLDGDGADETIVIDGARGSLTITDGDTAYHSRNKWHIVQTWLGDTDHDGLPEVVALLDAEDGRHLGLFAFFGGEYRERLVTSALVPPPLALKVVDSKEVAQEAGFAGEYAGDVIVLTEEGAGDDAAGGPATRDVVYRWNGFGFTAVLPAPSE
ncbi:MAG: hypothetical protein LLG45_05110 [Actinomycetia bacterium]|nr:hypothetical protein [Actinomycetes bacterium]